MNKVLFSSANDVWATPQNLFDELDKEFNFTLDPCALPDNAKCAKYYTPAEDGLAQSWGGSKYFVTRPTAGRSTTGYGRLTTKARSQVLQW